MQFVLPAVHFIRGGFCSVTDCISAVICFLCNVFHNVWPLGTELKQKRADCIDLEHIKLQVYRGVSGGPQGFLGLKGPLQ